VQRHGNADAVVDAQHRFSLYIKRGDYSWECTFLLLRNVIDDWLGKPFNVVQVMYDGSEAYAERAWWSSGAWWRELRHVVGWGVEVTNGNLSWQYELGCDIRQQHCKVEI
jgi:hypothetical protein